jgi:HEAT repeat protein
MASSATEPAREPMSTRAVEGLLAELHALDPVAREQAKSTLQTLDRGALVEELGRLLGSRDPELRYDAAEALLRIEADRAIEQVLLLLGDPDSTVRWHTCGLLHDFGDPRAIPLLVPLLLTDPEADVRLMAAYALSEIGDRSALSALRQAAELDDGTDYEGRRVGDAATEAMESIIARET